MADLVKLLFSIEGGDLQIFQHPHLAILAGGVPACIPAVPGVTYVHSHSVFNRGVIPACQSVDTSREFIRVKPWINMYAILRCGHGGLSPSCTELLLKNVAGIFWSVQNTDWVSFVSALHARCVEICQVALKKIQSTYYSKISTNDMFSFTRTGSSWASYPTTLHTTLMHPTANIACHKLYVLLRAPRECWNREFGGIGNFPIMIMWSLHVLISQSSTNWLPNELLIIIDASIMIISCSNSRSMVQTRRCCRCMPERGFC